MRRRPAVAVDLDIRLVAEGGAQEADAELVDDHVCPIPVGEGNRERYVGHVLADFNCVALERRRDTCR